MSQDWNEKAFINVMKESNSLEKVKELDRKPEMWDKYYNEPVFTDEQKKRHLENMSNFKKWLINKILNNGRRKCS